MANNTQPHTLHIRIKASLGKKLLIGIPHTSVLLLLLWAHYFYQIGIIYTLILVAVVLSSWLYAHRLHIRMTAKNAIQHLYRDTKTQNWTIQYANSASQKPIPATLLPSSFSSHYLIILSLGQQTDSNYLPKKQTVLITPDSVDADTFRRLNVYLTTYKPDKDG